MRYATLAPLFAHLNWPADEAGAGARGRVLGRLGEYAALIIGPLNMRPTGATLVHADDERVEVRVSSAASNVLLVLAVAGDLAAEVFFLRSLAQQHLPAPRLIAHDLSCGLVPFSWAVLGHVSGAPLADVADDALLRLGSRQAGRVLRRIHQHPAPGFGRPQPSGRWPIRGWREALGMWLARREARPRAGAVLGPERAAALWAATIEHLALGYEAPSALHGALEPARVLVTGAGASMHLEALARPGELVGGDPLFDLAYGLLPCHPGTFRRGLFEGYVSSGALSAAQHERLARLQLLVHAAETMRRDMVWELAALPGQVDEQLYALGEHGRA